MEKLLCERAEEFITENGVSAVRVSGIPTLSLFKSFDCGQCFRFDPVSLFGNKFEVGGVALGRYVVFAQNNENEIIIYNSTMDDYRKIWHHYLALDEDYDAIDKSIVDIAVSEHMKRAAEYGRGIRILRQDGWECLISFIISQNNNIPRIKKIIATLCRKYGERIEFLGEEHYTFPSIEALSLASEAELFELRTGFRAKYIASACKSVASGETSLDYISSESDFDKCVEHLCTIKGVGLKVASCALLFGFDKTEAFPIDVHMKRTLEKYFPSGLDINALGKNAGIAQQYLFYYEKYSQSS